jgi:hypothetical protein
MQQHRRNPPLCYMAILKSYIHPDLAYILIPFSFLYSFSFSSLYYVRYFPISTPSSTWHILLLKRYIEIHIFKNRLLRLLSTTIDSSKLRDHRRCRLSFSIPIKGLIPCDIKNSIHALIASSSALHHPVPTIHRRLFPFVQEKKKKTFEGKVYLRKEKKTRYRSLNRRFCVFARCPTIWIFFLSPAHINIY